MRQYESGEQTGDDTMAIEIGLFPSKEEEKELEEEEMEANEEPGSQMSALNDLEADPNFTQLRKMLAEFDASGTARSVEAMRMTHSDVLGVASQSRKGEAPDGRSLP